MGRNKFRDTILSDKKSVTVVVSRTVFPGRERDYDEWVRRLVAAAAQAHGNIGVTMLIPAPGKPGLYHVVFRFADDLLRGEKRYRALRRLLGQEAPHITGCRPGADIIDESRDPFPQIIEAIANMDHSHLFIQGPPGAGKTWTGAHVIKELLHRGFKIGVSSNSHKAINNLLRNIEAAARKRKIRFRGVKKSVEMNQDSLLDGEMIADVFRNDEIYRDARLPVRRRSGAGRHGKPRRNGNLRPEHRPSRRSDATRPADSGRPSGALRGIDT